MDVAVVATDEQWDRFVASTMYPTLLPIRIRPGQAITGVDWDLIFVFPDIYPEYLVQRVLTRRRPGGAVVQVEAL